MFLRESSLVYFVRGSPLTNSLHSMATLSYKKMARAQYTVLLVLSAALFPIFSLWVKWQVKRNKAALIHNALWLNLPFLFICVAMFFTWAAFNAFQYISTLFFQDVQNISAPQASIRFLPMAVVGAVTNVLAAHLFAKVNVNMLLGVSAVITAMSPILMAVASPEWTYWAAAFVAMTLSPVNGDGEWYLIHVTTFVLKPKANLLLNLVPWTVSSLVICRAFPSNAQAIAGSVFNTISQLGNSVGLAVAAVVAASVSAHDESDSGSDTGSSQTPEQLLDGYRAAYWTIFAGIVVVCLVRRVGIKQD